MVQWKGNLDQKQVGKKAANLNSVKDLEVPNFFVLTKGEIGQYLDSTDPREILNQKLPEKLEEAIHDAYDDIGMSSEVRNASGQARNLVGGQRENQKVSIRISSETNGSDYKLNVGASKLENALKQVLASHYRENDSTPAVIFQKMIEPDYTGAVIQNYTRRHSLIETVEGLGHSIEEGLTTPEFYLLENNSITETRIPQKQVKVTRNPMNGERRKRTVTKNSQSFQNNEIQDIVRKASRTGMNLKFAYKRGTFYITDAFNTQPLNIQPDLEALKVSEGEIKGRQGKDYILTDEPKQTEKPQVAKKGGFTTKAAYQARQNKQPAVFSLKDTEQLETEEKAAQTSEMTQKKGIQKENTVESQAVESGSAVTATEVRSIKDFPQLSNNPFNLEESEVKFADDCEQILADQPELIDGRNIQEEALLKAVETVEDVQVLVIEEASEKILEKVVEQGVEILAVPENTVKSVRARVLRMEKRFILDNLRN